MVCEHLRALEDAVRAMGANETYRGQAWSDNCREWVYFDIVLPMARLRRELKLDPCVEDHENADTKSGRERGFCCAVHHDGVIGLFE